MSSDLVPQVLEALASLYSNSDAAAKKQAMKWLESFQKKAGESLFMNATTLQTGG